MTIGEILMNQLVPSGTYRVGFTPDSDSYKTDETLFLVWSADELTELWYDFAHENNIPVGCVEYVEMEQTDVEIFEEYSERTTATFFKDWAGWHICDGDEIVLNDWHDMISYMDAQNDLMRG